MTTSEAAAAGVSQWHELGSWLTSRSSWLGSANGSGALHLLLQHVWISGLSLAIACLIAIPLAVRLGRMRRGAVFVTSLANAARAIPIVGILILLAIGPLGIGNRAAIVALVIFAIPPVLTNAYAGITGVDVDVTAAATGMGMSRSQLSRRVELPLAIPLIATGVRLAAVQVWATATIAAIVGSGGLGQLIVNGYGVQNYGEVYGGTIVIIVTAIALDALLALLQSRLSTRYAGAPARGHGWRITTTA